MVFYGGTMWNVVMNYIPTDKDINIMSCDIVNKVDDCDSNVYVYLAKIEDVILYNRVFNGCESKIERQSNAGLSLLKYAVKDRWDFDLDINNIKIDSNGKPYTNGYSFSISHCGELVCVAISKHNVGVDLECKTKSRQWQMLKRRVLTANEIKSITNIDSQKMTELWTKKEAIFKLLGDKVFSPNTIDVDEFCTETIDFISLEDNDYIISVATEELSNKYLLIKKICPFGNNWDLI